VCRLFCVLFVIALGGCVAEIAGETGEDAAAIVPPPPDAAPPRPPDAGADAAGCPGDMAPVGDVCMDRHEAPNVAGAPPLVMYSFDEAEDWCQARGKRLCYDDEWTAACAGAAGHAYPYGPTRVPGRCNDAKTWKVYTQSLLNGWPAAASAAEVASLGALLARARGAGAAGKAAADHVAALYQAEGAGAYPGCVGAAGVYDLVGSVEEWTRRRDGGEPQFHGNLKGRYWAESRTCQQGVKVHGDLFRFYEIGFRCCRGAD
jgi:formylglycine-generating enzyme required for sulfatase activity